MTKNNFIALADYLHDPHGYCESFTLKQIEHLANFCHAQNPNFKRDRWLKYIAGVVGPSGGKVKS